MDLSSVVTVVCNLHIDRSIIIIITVACKVAYCS
jgi:hypothetical protein